MARATAALHGECRHCHVPFLHGMQPRRPLSIVTGADGARGQGHDDQARQRQQIGPESECAMQAIPRLRHAEGDAGDQPVPERVEHVPGQQRPVHAAVLVVPELRQLLRGQKRPKHGRPVITPARPFNGPRQQRYRARCPAPSCSRS